MGLFQWPLWAVEFADFQLALVDLRYPPPLVYSSFFINILRYEFKWKN